MGKLSSTLPLALAPTRTLSSSSTTSPTVSLSSHNLTRQTTLRTATQVRHANFIARPRRPYTFTQLVTLSDGSAYTIRTTAPHPIHRSTKDSRNTLLWQPSDRSLRNVELDEAGKLAAFRERFGRGFERTQGEQTTAAAGAQGSGEQQQQEDEGGDFFADLMSGYSGQSEQGALGEAGPKRSKARRK